MTADGAAPSEPTSPPAAELPAHGGRLALGVVIVALAAAGFAIAFREALKLALEQLNGTADVVSAIRALPLWARCAMPATGGLIAGLLGLICASDRGDKGVGNVMEAIVLGRGRLSLRVTLVKSLASWVAIASGGSIGREGPLIQFGGAAGQTLGERLRLPPSSIRLLIAAGTAAGFTAAYNTPFAAVLFVLEVVTGVVVLDVFVPALIATVIAAAVTRATAGTGPLYGQRAFVLISPTELLAFGALGLAIALVAQGFMRLLSLSERAFHRPWLKLPWRSALGGAIAGAIAAALPEVAGNGYEPLTGLLDGKMAVGFVALLVVGKCVATSASVSSGSPGGVFTPTLLIGGATGFLFGTALAAAGLPVGSPGGYALVGMAAATSATTHAPLMGAVMIFELSGDYAIVLPLMMATAAATWLSRRLRTDSIYTAELTKAGVAWELTLDGRRVTTTPP